MKNTSAGESLLGIPHTPAPAGSSYSSGLSLLPISTLGTLGTVSATESISSHPSSPHSQVSSGPEHCLRISSGLSPRLPHRRRTKPPRFPFQVYDRNEQYGCLLVLLKLRRDLYRRVELRQLIVGFIAPNGYNDLQEAIFAANRCTKKGIVNMTRHINLANKHIVLPCKSWVDVRTLCVIPPGYTILLRSTRSDRSRRIRFLGACLDAFAIIGKGGFLEIQRVHFKTDDWRDTNRLEFTMMTCVTRLDPNSNRKPLQAKDVEVSDEID